MAEAKDTPHDHLEIHALIDGGYVVREGRFDHGERFENGDGARWMWRQERAAFSTLEDAITLKDAASHFGFKVSTLRAEADRGRLTIYKIGKRYYTTPNDIKDMVQKCRVDQKGLGFTLIRGGNSGSSETGGVSSALAAARETAQGLKSSSRNTSATSTVQSRQVRR